MENLNIVGKIESINSSSGETNGKKWKRHAVIISGATYSTFDEDLVKDFGVGETVNLHYTVNGKFKTLVAMEKSDEVVEETTEGFKSAGELPDKGGSQDKIWLDKDKRIARQSCLRTATMMYEALSNADPEKAKEVLKEDTQIVDLVISVAGVLEEWVWRE